MPTFIIWYFCITMITNIFYKKKGITFFRRQLYMKKRVLFNLQMENLDPCFHKKEKLWLTTGELLVLERTSDCVTHALEHCISVSKLAWDLPIVGMCWIRWQLSIRQGHSVYFLSISSVSLHESLLHQKDAIAIIISVILKRCFKVKKRRLISRYQHIFRMEIFLSFWLDIFASASSFIEWALFSPWRAKFFPNHSELNNFFNFKKLSSCFN